jgi:hypothetical protein
VTCLGAYIVVDVVERWTGDERWFRSVLPPLPPLPPRSVAGKTQPQASIDVLNSGEECGVAGLKAAASRGVRFYHAVLKRVGDWHKGMAVQAEAGRSSLKNKRKRGQ